MPLKIRCPHCQKTLLAEEWTIGEPRRCPSCTMGFTVPIPFEEDDFPDDAPAAVGVTCPRCQHPLASGNPLCRRCFTDLRNGERLSYRSRLWYGSTWAWAQLVGSGLLVMAAAIGGTIGVRHWLDQKPPPTPIPVVDPIGRAESQALFQARTGAERDAALRTLQRLGDRGTAAFIARFEEETKEISTRQIANLRAAIEYVRSIEPSVEHRARLLPGLSRCTDQSALRADAEQARGLLGDADALPELRRQWLGQLRRLLFYERFARQSTASSRAALDHVLRAERRAFMRIVAALRALERSDAETVLARLVDSFWISRRWLGQRTTEGFSEALFRTARSAVAGDEGLEFGPAARDSIRTARRRLDRTAGDVAPDLAGAIGLTLKQMAPQYARVRTRIVERLAKELASGAPEERQRIAWALAQLSGRSLGGLRALDHPLDVKPAHIEAVDRFARFEAAGGGNGDPLRHPERGYPARPRFPYRVISASAQHEHALLAEMRTDAQRATAALDTWRRMDLGCTPRVPALLDVRTEMPALQRACGLVLAAECAPDALTMPLRLWRLAQDEPDWLRELASALRAVHEHDGGAKDAWAVRLRAAAPAHLHRFQLECLGRILGRGRPDLLQLLSKSKLSDNDQRMVRRFADRARNDR